MADPGTIATVVGAGAGGAGLGAWLTKVLIRRTLTQFDEAIKDVVNLKVTMAVQKALLDEVMKPLREDVKQLGERMGKAEAALAKGWDTDKKLQESYFSLVKHVKNTIDGFKKTGGAQ